MTGPHYQQRTAIIIATPSERAQFAQHFTIDNVDHAIRSARRQVQRYGDEARDALLSWCRTEEEREWMRHALGPARVGTVVREWDERTRNELPPRAVLTMPAWYS